MTDTQKSSVLTDVKLPFPPAERLGAKVEYYHFLPHEKSYAVDVYFIRQAPDPDTIDRVMRECLALAAAHDGRFRISGSAYLAPGDDIDVHERRDLLPWGKDRYLCFDADLRQIGVRRYGKKHFEEQQAITAVDAVGTGDNIDHPDRPSNPVYEGEDMEEDVDDATATQRGLVSEWLWYGYCSFESINRWIDENHAAGDGFDLAWIKAFAVRALARKRAAEALWPQVTDVDRLHQAFASLHEQGVCAVHWAGNDMDEGLEAVIEALREAYEAGVAEDHYWGVCYFHSQDMDRALDGHGLLLAFDAIGSEVAADMERVGRKVCEVLEQEGLKTRWNGRANSRIELPTLRWQRRTPSPD
jgi:hypothetical protein